MAKVRNLTLRVDESTIRAAKELAAKQGSSLSKLFAQMIEEKANKDTEYWQAY